MYWGMFQRSTFGDGVAAAGRANTKAEQTSEEVKRLEAKVDTLALACQSIWELVHEHTNASLDQLDRKMEEIDLRDGVKDGRMSPAAGLCSSCGRKTSHRRNRCIYCGERMEAGERFGKH